MNWELSEKLISARVYPDFYRMSSANQVINLGIGFGPQAMAFKNNYNFMVGTDINFEKLKYLNSMDSTIQRPLYNINCDVQNLPFKNNMFDTALAIDVLEHLDHPDRMMKEIYRILKNNGDLLITFPCLLDIWNFFLKKSGTLFAFRKIVPKYIERGNPLFIKIFNLKNGYFQGYYKYQKDPQINNLDIQKHQQRMGNPDLHKHNFSVNKWIKIIESTGLKIIKKRSTTLFPPLHSIGIKKFWYTNDNVYKIDSICSSMPVINRFGQSMLCLVKKPV